MTGRRTRRHTGAHLAAPGFDHRPESGAGWIEVICGPMFSGKTEELIRRIGRAVIARQLVQVFKPRLDDRYDTEHIVSHDARRIPSVGVGSVAEIRRKLDRETQVVGIDEAQFFGAGIVRLCEDMAAQGRRVIVAGLDQDYRGRPFEPVPQLLALAESITKNLAICVVCGRPAGRSQKIVRGGRRIEVGAANKYEARCRHCFRPRPALPTRGTPLAHSPPARSPSPMP